MIKAIKIIDQVINYIKDKWQPKDSARPGNISVGLAVCIFNCKFVKMAVLQVANWTKKEKKTVKIQGGNSTLANSNTALEGPPQVFPASPIIACSSYTKL